MVQHVLLEKCPPVYRNLLHFLELHLTFHQNMIHPDHGGGQCKKVFRILIEAETNMISLLKHHMLISLRELSFACPHPKKAPHLLLENRTSWWCFFFQLATNGLQTVDFLKQHVDRLQQGAPEKQRSDRGPLPCLLTAGEEVKSRGSGKPLQMTEPQNFWNLIRNLETYPSIHSSIHPSMCDMFWGAKFQFAYFASHVEERYTHTHNIANVLGVANPCIHCRSHGNSFV